MPRVLDVEMTFCATDLEELASKLVSERVGFPVSAELVYNKDVEISGVGLSVRPTPSGSGKVASEEQINTINSVISTKDFEGSLNGVLEEHLGVPASKTIEDEGFYVLCYPGESKEETLVGIHMPANAFMEFLRTERGEQIMGWLSKEQR